MLYAYCHRLSKAPAPLRVSCNKLNPSHGSTVGGGSLVAVPCGGLRLPPRSRLGRGHQARHQPPCMAHHSPQTFNPTLLFGSLVWEKQKTQLRVDVAKMYWLVNSKSWGGAVAWSGLLGPQGLALPLSLSSVGSTRRPPPGGYRMAAAATASGLLRSKSRGLCASLSPHSLAGG